MTWRDEQSKVTHPDGRQLIGASFRGEPFFVESSSRSGGRRSATHEFLSGDNPATDDLGGAARVFRLEGYVLGDDYMRQRDQVLSACENVSGPGELVHPFYGRQRVQCGPVGVRETIVDGGMAVFSFEFTLAPIISTPTETFVPSAYVAVAAKRTIIVNSDELGATLDIAGQPAFATASLSADLASVAAALEESLSGVASTTQEAALLSVELDILSAQAASLVRTPADMLSGLLGAIQQLSDSIEAAPLRVVNALLDAYGQPLQALAIGDTATRVKERANQAAIAGALRIVLIAEAARIVPQVAFESIGEAETTKGAIVAALDELAATASDTLYPELVGLRASVIRAVPGDAVLARIQTIERRTDTPSLLLAYQLYGSVEAEADVIARNKIRHPAFISGSIQVLSDV